MKYSVDPAVFQLNPSLSFGILVGKNLKNSLSTAEDIKRLRLAEEAVREEILPKNLRIHPNVAGYRLTMEQAGINPNKFPPSIEAMLKRTLKGGELPNINGLVDLCNAISLETQISLGGHDLKDIHADLSVGFTKGTERFLPFGATEYEGVEAGELVFTSEDVVQTRKWVWRQSELGKMTPDSSQVFFQLVGFDGENPKGSFHQAMDAVEELISQRFSGKAQRFIVTSKNPMIEF